MAKFNDISVETRFIKSILKNSFIPIAPTISEGDLMVGGAIYSYNNHIIECESTGVFGSKYTREAICSHMSICGPDFICGVGVRPAEYKIIYHYTPYTFEPGISSSFISTMNGYDCDTHKYLGKYLRYFRSTSGINLMPYYNCFTNKDTTLVSLSGIKVLDKPNNDKVVWSIPILLNKKYTIFLESSSPVSIGATFLNDTGRISTIIDGQETLLDSLLGSNVGQYQSLQITSPITFDTVTTNPKLFEYEDYLYMLIQVDKNHLGAITVLEGEYSQSGCRFISNSQFRGEDIIDFAPEVIPSLGTISNIKSTPFSDRLIEYLTQNAITPVDNIRNNIKKVKERLNLKDTKDIWTNSLLYILFNNYFTYTSSKYIPSRETPAEEYKSTLGLSEDQLVYLPLTDELVGTKNINFSLDSRKNIYDISGYVDKDVEKSLFGLGGNK